ncbi:unnamed protein product [Paramecium sonneborni]|uniref:Uncharacterized protein n=1 Tax=Paramecium sonneborni TaxID=65129 RepID=A0A8S1KCX1_9CILI|nr:unnamed protein product [Paramecium sonneborni]
MMKTIKQDTRLICLMVVFQFYYNFIIHTVLYFGQYKWMIINVQCNCQMKNS